MQLTLQEQGTWCVVTVEARRIDAAGAIAFKEAMRNLTEALSGPVILDLGQVDFVDSSGLGAIVAAMKTLGGKRRRHLAALTPNVERVFSLTRMDLVFPIHPSVAAALSSDDS